MWFFKFYKEVVREATTSTLSFLGFTSKVSTFRAVLLWAVTTLLIYQLSSHNILQARLEVGISSLFGVVLVAVGTFLGCLFLAPVRLWSAIEIERNELKEIIQTASTVESQLQELSALYYRGRELYNLGFRDLQQKVTWENSLQAWKDEVEEKLKAGFSV